MFIQQQPPEVFCKKIFLIIFATFTGKHLSFFLIKLGAATLLKKDFSVGGFFVNFAKFLATPFSENTSVRLLPSLYLKAKILGTTILKSICERLLLFLISERLILFPKPQQFKRAPKLYFTHYSCAVIILFDAGLCSLHFVALLFQICYRFSQIPLYSNLCSRIL